MLKKEEHENRKTEEEALRQFQAQFEVESAVTPVDLGYIPKHVSSTLPLDVDSKFAKTKENLFRLEQQRNQQRRLQPMTNNSGPQTVTDQVFDYLGEILDHNVLSDSVHQPTEEEQILEEIDLDAL